MVPMRNAHPSPRFRASATGKRQQVKQPSRSEEGINARLQYLSQDRNPLCSIFLGKDGNLGVCVETARHQLLGDCGLCLFNRESSNMNRTYEVQRDTPIGTDTHLLIGLRWLGRAEAGHDAPSPTTAVVLGNLLAALANFPFAFPVVSFTATDIATVLFLGVVQIGVAYLLLSRALKHVGAFEASLLLMVEPALNPFWSWLVHGETPGPWSLLGGGMILGASVVKSALDSRPRTVPQLSRTAPAGPLAPHDRSN